MPDLNRQDLDRHALRRAFGTFPTGVTVVTARAPDGTPVGFTANSFTSVSLDPPMLLVCPGRSLTCFPIFADCRHFAVNVLAEGQEDVSGIFASFRGDRFAEVAWHEDAASCPVIAGRAAHFSCTVAQRIEAGDHLILVGQVDAFTHFDSPGLGFAAGAYFNIQIFQQEAGR